MKYFFILTSILSVAIIQPQEIHFGQGVKVTIFENDSIAIGESPIRSEEACGSFVYPNGRKLISNGQTTWNEKGDTVFINKNANESTSQGVVFVPVKNVVTGQLLYVEQICLINLGRKEGANVTRYDSEGNLSKDSIKSLKFTGEHLLEEKMGVMVFEDSEKSAFTMYRLFFKEVGTNRVITFDINKYEKSPDVKIKYHYFKDSSSIGNYNTTGCMSVTQNWITYVNPADKRISNAFYDPILNEISYPNSAIVESAIELYGAGFINFDNYVTNKGNLIFLRNNYNSLYIEENFLKNKLLITDTNIRLASIYNAYRKNTANNSAVIAMPNSDTIIFLSITNNSIYKISNNDKSKPKVGYGMPIPLIYYKDICQEKSNFNLYGRAKKGLNSEVELTDKRLFTCGMYQFDLKLITKQNFRLSFQMKIFEGTNNGLEDGSEQGADGFAVVFSKEKPTDCEQVAGRLGYSGLKDAVAFEFDLYKNEDFNDPNGNHFAIMLPDSSTGVLSPVHPLNKLHKNDSIYSIYISKNNRRNFFDIQFTGDIFQFRISTDSVLHFIPIYKSDYRFKSIQELLKDGFYVSIYATTGNAVQNHSILAPRLCVYKPTTTSIQNEDEETKRENNLTILKDEVDKILANGGRLYDLTGRRINVASSGIFFLEHDKSIYKVIIIE
jgi:hypothetical protein